MEFETIPSFAKMSFPAALNFSCCAVAPTRLSQLPLDQRLEKGTKQQRFRSLLCGKKTTPFILEVLRVYCHACHKTQQVNFHFAEEHKRYTRFFERHVFDLLLSMTWKGQPLVSLRVMIELIGHTTSRSGLKVYTMEDDNKYPTKRKIDKVEFAALNLIRNDVLEKWNYKIAHTCHNVCNK